VQRGSKLIELSAWDTWLSILERDDILSEYREAFTTLALSYCENLQTLVVGHDLCYTPQSLALNVTEGETPGRTLSIFALANMDDLRAVELLRSDALGTVAPYTSPLVARLFSLPGVESLNLTVRELPDATDDSLLLNTTAPLLTMLVLQDSKVSERAIGTLLHPAPNLTSLRLALVRDANPPFLSTVSSFLDLQCSDGQHSPLTG